MRAAVVKQYGPPEIVALRDVPVPQPSANELLVRVRAATVSSGDARIRALRMPSPAFRLLARAAIGVHGPRRAVLGSDFAGDIVAIGAAVRSFRVGDAVVGSTESRFGTHAELVCIPESASVLKKPDALSYADAASLIFGGVTASQFLLETARLVAGQRIAIIGASGTVGVAAVQIAAAHGAHVTAVCSARNIPRVMAMGAHDAIDYNTREITHAQPFDVIFDTVGTTTFAHAARALAPRGIFLPAVVTMTEVRQVLAGKLTGSQRVRSRVALARKSDIERIMRWATSGRLRPVIDSVYALDDIREAHRRVDTGRKVGSVIITP